MIPSRSAVPFIAFALGCNGILGIDLPIPAKPDASELDATHDSEADVAVCSLEHGPCDIFPQCGCEDKTCAVANVTGATTCAPIGTTPLYNSCGIKIHTFGALGECGKGAECLG